MLIQGYLRDIQPRQPRPTLELYFGAKDRSSLPHGERVPIVLELGGSRWSGTVNSANSTNPPYVHTNLTLGDGTRRSSTEVFLESGLIEGARLEFDLANTNNLRLTRIVDKGKWRHGNASGERVSRTVASSAVFSATPRGSTRSSSIRAAVETAPSQSNMRDPLQAFDWSRLYTRYDSACRGFDPKSEYLRAAYTNTQGDRNLYYRIVGAANRRYEMRLTADWYKALLYWKLYSQPAAVSNIRVWLQSFDADMLYKFAAVLPKSLSRNVQDVVSLIELIGTYQLPGMKTSTALPVRTTILHFIYPSVVPIFDQMVLKAVAAWNPGANQDVAVLRRYMPHAWELADRYAQGRPNLEETPVRLVDMALWVSRN
jgi:hypothetical protein